MLNYIRNEIEIFIYIIETRSRVIIIPSIWLIVGSIIYFFVENQALNLVNNSIFSSVTEEIINKRLDRLSTFIFFSGFYLFCLLYIRERKRY